MEKNEKKCVSLSVIVPVYNERFLVETSLKSVLALQSEYLGSLQVIVVDDFSSDGSWEIVQRIAASDARITLLRHDKNSGKGFAIQTGLSHASNEITIIHDADLEYKANDIPSLLRVFVEEGADAVFGSRYLSAEYKRVLMFRHSIINKCITFFVNFFTDMDFTDVETCYKAIKTDLFKSIPIRSRDFRFEVEIAMKLARRKANIFEVPIRYLARSYEEGKKIKLKDGFLALIAIVRFFFIEDIFQRDRYGLHILMDLNNARRFNKWMADTLRPHLGASVLEIGAGIGNLTKQFVPRNQYVASDIDSYALQFLKSYGFGKPYFHVRKIDADSPEDFQGMEAQFDTVLLINVLEHLKDEQGSLKSIRKTLLPEGKLIVLVPQGDFLMGSLDEALEHRERYSEDKLRKNLISAGYEVETMFDFNRSSVPGWFLNGKILKRKRFSMVQLKVLEILMPFIRRFDRFWPWKGLSVIAIAKKIKV